MARLLPLRLSAALLSVALLLVPGDMYAYNPQTLQVGVGTNLTFWTIVRNIGVFLAGSILAISTAMFVVGAVLVMASGVKEDWRQRGKDFLIGSTLGIIVVLGAYALFRTVNCFLTPGCI